MAPTILQYAVNGRGLGHLTRQLAIARWLRRLGALLGGVELVFVTTSEADPVLWHEGLTSLKLPSRTALAALDAPSPLTITALARQSMATWMATLRPAVLVVDTFAAGAFGEVTPSLELAARRVLVLRHLRAASPDVLGAIGAYDAVLTTEDGALDDVPVPPGVRARARTLGPVLVRERGELLDRAEARALLDLPHQARCVLLTMGGGGDVELDGLLTLAGELVARGVEVVIGVGPLLRAHEQRRTLLASRLSPEAQRHVRLYDDARLAELARAFDGAVTAGGANTLHELWQAGVPTLVRPRARALDDQRRRAARAAELGAGAIVSPYADGDALLEALDALPPDAAARAETLVPRNDARHAAAAILEQCFAPTLVAAALAQWDDDALRAEARHGDGPRRVARAMSVLPAKSPRALAASAAYLDRARDLGLPTTTAELLAELLGRRLLVGELADRLAAIGEVARAFAALADWPGALAIVRALDADELTPATELASALVALVDDAHARGLGTVALLDLLLAQHHLDGRAREPAAQLARARAALDPGLEVEREP